MGPHCRSNEHNAAFTQCKEYTNCRVSARLQKIVRCFFKILYSTGKDLMKLWIVLFGAAMKYGLLTSADVLARLSIKG